MTVKLIKKVPVNKWSYALLLLFLVPIFTYAKSPAELQNGLLSDLYFRNAVKEYNNGNYEISWKLTSIALSFSSSSSDLFYLKSLQEYKKGQYYTAVKSVEDALLRNNWTYYENIEGQIFFARIQYQLNQAGAAYRNLLPYRNFILSQADTAELYTKIALALGKVTEAVTIATKFPRESFAQIILAKYDNQWRQQALATIKNNPDTRVNLYTKAAVQTLINVIIKSNKIEQVPFYLDYYENRWGQDRFSTINSLCRDTSDPMKLLNALFAPGATVRRKEILRIQKILDSKNIQYTIPRFFQNKSFTITDDTNNDGINDMVTIIESGKLRKVTIDTDQDGIPDYVIGIKNGTVKSIEINAAKNVVAEFLQYPYLSTYKVINQGIVQKYTLVPYSMKFSKVIVPANPILQVVKINSYVKLPLISILELNSSDFTRKKIDEKSMIKAERTSLSNTIVSFFNDQDKKYRQKEYKGRVPYSENRDIDGDGIPDLFYTYQNGRLKSISYDKNHNNHPEYTEEFFPEKETKWDFNDDGIYDYIDLDKGTFHIQKYSTKMNGIFDIQIEHFQDGTVKYIQTSGTDKHETIH